ncbi:TIGR01777 family oxidoreductase [Zunongwangia endophytica]|uniref:TIGR01777 family oxidoreductase n=1 Tax=Zunongwangia endophytica TaxID=1808945 RepID=A0ABV8HF91_9FLAO|nr:TIGR01777 family oxidoreductase [Zunongwangia endophytica]MDN3593352.1 TIGR01777 family oxidoreductase [Zunongwangia endophytica]
MRVLITGATGLIGTKISALCHEKGIDVNYLTTSEDKIQHKDHYRGFLWNPQKGEIDKRAIDNVDAIINLVGASIAQRWTDENKRKILNSRVESTNLLCNTLSKNDHQIKQIVSASAIGVYPSSLQKLYFEDKDAIDDSFVGDVVVKWESAVDNFKDLGLKVSKIRIGLVMAKNGGMLEKLKEPVKFNIGAPLGTGKQWQSWIHISDLTNIFMYVLENGLSGTFNGVAPNPVTNKEMTKEVANQLNKPLWLPNVPGFVLKTYFGEMATLLLSSQLVSSKKIEEQGYHFQYLHLQPALDDLL